MNVLMDPCHRKARTAYTILSLSVLLSLCVSDSPAQSPSVETILTDAIEKGSVIGAQILTGSSRQDPTTAVNLGVLGPKDPRRVTADSMFCIASCSKPLVAAVIFALIDQNRLDLTTPTGNWIHDFREPRLSNGTPTRSPNLRELLCHRGGLYSQKEKLNSIQLKAIRDFRLTLTQSVNLITQQPLISSPGNKYAYSGAGYCLIGGVAESATGKPIDVLLQHYLCIPAGMSSTTFFPTRRVGAPIATGGFATSPPPHLLGTDMKLPLVGGSIHTTAEDLQRFARMVLAKGVSDRKRVLSLRAWTEYVSQPYQDQSYGYGWNRMTVNGTTLLSHNGSLPPAQAMVRVNLGTSEYQIVLWTLANPRNAKLTASLRQQINSALK